MTSYISVEDKATKGRSNLGKIISFAEVRFVMEVRWQKSVDDDVFVKK